MLQKVLNVSMCVALKINILLRLLVIKKKIGEPKKIIKKRNIKYRIKKTFHLYQPFPVKINEEGLDDQIFCVSLF